MKLSDLSNLASKPVLAIQSNLLPQVQIILQVDTIAKVAVCQ